MIKKALITIVLIVLVAAAAGLGYFYIAYPRMRPAPDMKAPTTAEAVERGRYLVEAMTGCGACHSPVDESRPGDFPQPDLKFAGRVFPPEAGLPGTIVAPNLTPDPETGIGNWTDGEIVRAMREGVSKDGTPLFPFMNYPEYRNLTDADALAIVAYLRTQKPVRRDVGRTDLDFPVNLIVRTMPVPLETPPAGLPAAGIERGRAMVKLMLCGDCHTPMDDRGQRLADKQLAGGMRFAGAFGEVHSANITSHPSAGIGAYSDEDLKRVFREGKNRAGRELWVMPWSVTKNLTDADLDALIAALREIPPNPNLVPAPSLRR